MDKLKDESLLNHDIHDDPHGAVVPPLYQNSLFTFKDWDAIDHAFDHKADAFIYSRLLNPTVKIAEDKIAALCRGDKAKLCASGIAAVTSAILHCVKAGDHIITINNVYGPTNTFINKYLKNKLDISASYVDGRRVEDFEQAILPETKLIYLESPASLTMELQDLRAVAALARNRGIKTVIDNTWCSPMYQKPLELGIDIEVHSASKYLGGHSDVVAGVIISDKATMDAIITAEHELLGAKMAPFEGWLILRSLRTLPIRMEAIMRTSLDIAARLEKHAAVRKVNYPGLPSSEQYALGQKQMTGYGGLMSFELATTEIEEIKTFVNNLRLFSLGVSWGGHDSLVYAPVISYLKELTPDKFAAMGINPSLIRISIGLEHVEDLWRDLDAGLARI